MTLSITDRSQIKYLLEVIDENETKKTLKTLYPNWPEWE
jgi:hypothetical protein